jgi:glycosyltransferase involved in cell wall biosynthesis
MAAKKSSRSVLIYEPSVDGHHVPNLSFITEDLLAAGVAVTLAVDMRPAALKRIAGQMAELLPHVNIIPALPEKFAAAKVVSPAQVADCLEKSGAALAFLAHFNDLASTVLRRAAFGRMPDARLRGRLGGIYLRPQFLADRWLVPNQALKKIGFHRLMQSGWLNPLLLFDSQLCELARKRYPDAPIYPLADPYPENFAADRAAARNQFNLPADKFVFLFYGGGYQRKGLHLAVAAMLKISPPNNAFLLCAGLQPQNQQLSRDLETLRSQGRAEIVDRYVSAGEEKQLFAACDAVLLPYLGHQGTSGILSRAAGAGKPAIASDENLIGHVVRHYQMGLLFQSGNVPALQSAMGRAAAAPEAELSKWQAGAQAYAKNCSRGVFRSALVAAVETALAVQK